VGQSLDLILGTALASLQVSDGGLMSGSKPGRTAPHQGNRAAATANGNFVHGQGQERPIDTKPNGQVVESHSVTAWLFYNGPAVSPSSQPRRPCIQPAATLCNHCGVARRLLPLRQVKCTGRRPVKRSGSLISDFGLYFGDVIGHLTAIKPAVAREMLSRILWGVQTRQILLLAVSFWASPPLSGAVSQDAAPATPPVEFTVQTGHTADIQGLEYAANGKFFVSGGKDSTIKVWSPEGTLIRTIRTGFWVNYLALSHDGQLLVAATRTGNIFLLSLDGRVVHRFPDIPMREGFVSAVALSDDNRHAAIGTTRGLALYRLEGTVETRLQPEGDASEVESLLYTRDGRLVSGHPDGKLGFWTDEGKLLRTIAAHEYSIKTLALSPDGKTLATAGSPSFFAEIPKSVKPVTKSDIPPRSGWLDGLGRLEGGRFNPLDVARCAPPLLLAEKPAVPNWDHP
jgi:WD domain, G-beta repeat